MIESFYADNPAVKNNTDPLQVGEEYEVRLFHVLINMHTTLDSIIRTLSLNLTYAH